MFWLAPTTFTFTVPPEILEMLFRFCQLPPSEVAEPVMSKKAVNDHVDGFAVNVGGVLLRYNNKTPLLDVDKLVSKEANGFWPTLVGPETDHVKLLIAA